MGEITETIVAPTEKGKVKEVRTMLEKYRASGSTCEVAILEIVFNQGWADFEVVQQEN